MLLRSAEISHAACEMNIQLQPFLLGYFGFIVGATGTGLVATSPASGATGPGVVATSPACGATGPGLIATSGAFAGCAAAQGEGGPCNQSGDTKARQDLFQVVYIHDCLLRD